MNYLLLLCWLADTYVSCLVLLSHVSLKLFSSLGFAYFISAAHDIILYRTRTTLSWFFTYVLLCPRSLINGLPQ